ncbi:hypothetical protein KSS87_008473 [Heliosperma pusillum]|nr:hypothetical protein KSS87_008473 [Heliosperma pusillum]
MDYPHGHVNHHSHHQNSHHDDDNHRNNIYPPPPPPFTHSPFPPPPPFTHGGGVYPPPPPSYGGGVYPPPPPPQPHVESPNYPPPPQPPQHSSSHHFHPHIPSFIGSHLHHGGPDDHGSSTHSHGPEFGPGMGLGQLVNKPSHKINCKAGGERYAVGIRDGKVVLMHPDHTNPTQHWYKDEKYSTKVKDKDGHPSFILVNKGTEQAVKHSVSCHPVQLAPYRPDVLDESVLWTESRDLGSGFRTIRTVNNVHLVMDAWNADKDHGGIHDGTVLALYETWKGDNQNQQWKFSRHCK